MQLGAVAVLWPRYDRALVVLLCRAAAGLVHASFGDAGASLKFALESLCVRTCSGWEGRRLLGVVWEPLAVRPLLTTIDYEHSLRWHA